MKYQAIRGMKDILPGEVERWQAIEALAREFFPRFGYREVRSPILEKTDLFVRSIGEATDVVEKEMYTFTDLSGDSVTMRPEATAQMCRTYVEHKLHAQGGGWKAFTIGPMFRYERPQKGRFRQFHQIDVEVFGQAEGLIDAELIGMLVGFLERCKVGNVTVRLNSLGCKECRPDYREVLIGWLKEREEKLCEDCKRRLTLNPLRVLDCKKKTCRQVVDGAPAAVDHLCRKCEDSFAVVRTGLDGLEINYVLDNRLVRGLDYYVGTTFEVTSDKLGGQDAVCGGGRYDDLIAEIGGPAQPGTGFAIGIERLLLLSEIEAPKPRPWFFIAPLEEKDQVWALKIANKLRKAGMTVELVLENKSLKAQMKRANKTKSRLVIMRGPDEREKDQALIRNLDTGVQGKIDQPFGTFGEFINDTKEFINPRETPNTNWIAVYEGLKKLGWESPSVSQERAPRKSWAEIARIFSSINDDKND